MNVTLFPTASEAGDKASSTGEADGGAGHPVRGGVSLDLQCRPNSDLALASSNAGVYMDAGGGAATNSVEIEPGEYIAVPSTFSPQEAAFVLTVYSAPPISEVKRVA